MKVTKGNIWKVIEGDICVLDESVEYSYTSHEPYEVLVLWNGINNQPLVTRTSEYRPFWTTYSQLTEIKGHIDLAKALKAGDTDGNKINNI